MQRSGNFQIRKWIGRPMPKMQQCILVEHHKIVLTTWKLEGFIKLHVNQVSKDTKH
jgi:hypothetical protein